LAGFGFIGFGFIGFGNNVYCQQAGGIPAKETPKKESWLKQRIHDLKRSVSRDTATPPAFTIRNENTFKPYEGKIIRHIYVHCLGFDKRITDSSGIKYFGTRILNSLHRNSRDWVLKQNIYIKEGTELNPYLLADNERYLRSLQFMRDALISVNTIPNSPDSVDLYITTKDLFSITGEIANFNQNTQDIALEDVNFLGLGQNLRVRTLIENTRVPAVGTEFFLRKSNVAGTFINATLNISNIRPNIYNGSPNEEAKYFQLVKPFYSRYQSTSGALTIGQGETKNAYPYQTPASMFYKYSYNYYDIWAGYNLSAKKLLAANDLKVSTAVALRYFRYDFTQRPYQVASIFDRRFDSRQGVLGALLFYKQNFYKTNYFFGFGTTEDAPHGFNAVLIGGWYKQRNTSRPYLGINTNIYNYTKNGAIIQYFIRSGTLYNNGFEDAGILTGASVYSKLVNLNTLKIREHLRFSYSQIFNRHTLDSLRINNIFGLNEFRSDSIGGSRRISAQSETMLYTRLKIFGFAMAPFLSAEATLLTPEQQAFKYSKPYYGLGGGIRTRNENLVFGTIELRAVWFPRRPVYEQPFKLQLSSNLRFRFNQVYITGPDLNNYNINQNGEIL
jgi:hypothetical protein